MNVETKYSDRAVTVEGADKEVWLTLIDRSTKNHEIAYLAGGGAHALADWIKANVPKPKPAWHDAKHNEIWVLFVSIAEKAYRVDGSSFVPVNNPSRVRIPFDSHLIQEARRIWPAPEGETNA